MWRKNRERKRGLFLIMMKREEMKKNTPYSRKGGGPPEKKARQNRRGEPSQGEHPKKGRGWRGSRAQGGAGRGSIIWTPSIPKIPMNSKFCSYGGKQEMQQTKEISCDNLSACREQIYNEILAEMKALASGIQQAVSNAASPQKRYKRDSLQYRNGSVM